MTLRYHPYLHRQGAVADVQLDEEANRRKADLASPIDRRRPRSLNAGSLCNKAELASEASKMDASGSTSAVLPDLIAPAEPSCRRAQSEGAVGDYHATIEHAQHNHSNDPSVESLDSSAMEVDHQQSSTQQQVDSTLYTEESRPDPAAAADDIALFVTPPTASDSKSRADSTDQVTSVPKDVSSYPFCSEMRLIQRPTFSV